LPSLIGRQRMVGALQPDSRVSYGCGGYCVALLGQAHGLHGRTQTVRISPRIAFVFGLPRMFFFDPFLLFIALFSVDGASGEAGTCRCAPRSVASCAASDVPGYSHAFNPMTTLATAVEQILSGWQRTSLCISGSRYSRADAEKVVRAMPRAGRIKHVVTQCTAIFQILLIRTNA